MQLGDKVKDKITGFTGIVVGYTNWLNGCARLTVQSEKLKDGLPTDTQAFDLPQLELIKSKKVSRGPRRTGGPIPTQVRRMDAQRR